MPAAPHTDVTGILAHGVAAGAWLGAVGAWGDADGIQGLRAAGCRADGSPLHGDVIFDLASLTKPLATGTALARLHQRGDLDPAEPLDAAVPLPPACADRRITLGHLATHAAGLGNEKPDPALRGADALDDWRRRAQIHGDPGREFRYSCLGAVLVGEHAGVRLGNDLERIVAETIARPLGVTLTYHPPRDDALVEPGSPIAPRGVPADEPAAAIGRPLGHAGLFASAETLGRVCAALLATGSGRPSPLPLTPSDLQAVWAAVAGAPCPFGLLWNRDAPRAGIVRPAWASDGAVGHGGFTGQNLWLDPRQGRFALVCSNRLHVPGAVGPAWQARAQMTARWLGVATDLMR